MSQTDSAARNLSIDSTFNAITSRRRRRILAFVGERREGGIDSVTLNELARELAAEELGKPAVSVTTNEFEERRTALVHVELPLLEDAGLLAWDREAGAVSLPDDLVLDGATIRKTTERNDTNWDAVFEALANERRRTALAVLDDASEPLSVAVLASEVAAEVGASEADVRTTLTHQHLPALEAAGLVTVGEKGVMYADDHLEDGIVDTDFATRSRPLVAGTSL
ncbi:DUF7344 domain-containing protein [Natronosalvus rutilus]|uniref:DUF7344 domain-containing protein n=1 Tax=Natronosalvus rutilus TaxID=2953753 RepID=A0A9E7NBH3_9EURY|nr:hypothetical protein [Natronosalvus rutilus]UTF54376.1 hypothetical protein NGM29_03590 [Natronosalvus rutilus]